MSFIPLNENFNECENKLNNDEKKIILSFLDISSLCNMNCVSKSFTLSQLSNDDLFWKDHYKKFVKEFYAPTNLHFNFHSNQNKTNEIKQEIAVFLQSTTHDYKNEIIKFIKEITENTQKIQKERLSKMKYKKDKILQNKEFLLQNASTIMKNHKLKECDCKMVAVGDGFVGKTCMLMVLCEIIPNCKNLDYTPTVMDNTNMFVSFNNNLSKKYSIGLWDIGGQEIKTFKLSINSSEILSKEQLLKEQLEENDNTNTELTQQQDDNNNLKEENEQKELKEEDNERNVGIVIAHPDDEAMFFTPLIQSLNEMNNNLNNLNTDNTDNNFKNKKKIKIHLLCLSSGNANGIGKERIFELEKSCKILNILNQDEHIKVILNNNTLINKDNLINNTLINKERMKGNCIIIEDEELLDGMDKIWNLDKISWLVEEFVEQNKITKIFTFDKFGISNHPNHIATFNGIIKFKLKTLQKQNQIDCYQLITNNNIFRKYSSIFEFVTSLHFNNENTITLFTPQFLKSWKAMKAHESQFVWFRKLFILFSTYTYVNTFTKIE
ncbi:hypothetical protein ABK040_007647 [Willaertia magna]